MSEKRMRMGSALLAVCVVVASLSLVLDRAAMRWGNPIAIPYADPTDAHWLYRSLDVLDADGRSMGIWGWAAHLWVKSGTIPATRESSTEFAFLDWGPESYYRNRYLQSITQRPPEFFVEATGPGQFLFEDRTTHGMAKFPELNAFIGANYEEIFDDESLRLYVHRAYFDACCSWHDGWKDELGVARRFGSYASIRTIDSHGWVVSDAADAGGVHSLTMDLPASAEPATMIFPFSPGTSPTEGHYSITVTGLGDCAEPMAHSVVMQPTLCMIDIPAGHAAQVLVTDASPQPGGWLAVGRVLVVKRAVR